MNVALTTAQVRFVDEQVESGRYLDRGEVIRAALRSMALSHGGEADIMESVFLAVMEAARGAREDLKSIMNGVKAINAAKQRIRLLLHKVDCDVAENSACDTRSTALDFSRGLGSERAYHRVAVPRLDPEVAGGVRDVSTDLHAGKITSVQGLRCVADVLKGELDSLSEMGGMESLRLQMAMDRLSKLMSTLSNILKKASETAQGITQNLK